MMRLYPLLACAAISLVARAAVFDVRSFGAKGDGCTVDTVAIQRAIDAAEAAGGGEVLLSGGTFLSGSVFLKDNIDFHVAAGTTLLGATNVTDYNAWDICPQNWKSTAENTMGGHLLLCIQKRNVTVRGPGKIDGHARFFAADKDGQPYPRQKNIPWRPGQMLYFVESEQVRVQDIELADSPYWTCFLHGCTRVWLRGLDVHSLRKPYSHNGDGLDIDSCQYVQVSDCRINTSDDAIAIRADGKRLTRPQDCAYVTIANCNLTSDKCAIRVGVGNGLIHDVVCQNITVSDSRTAVSFCPSWSALKACVRFRNLRFSNFAVDCQTFCRMMVLSSENAVIENVTFDGFSGRTTEPAYVFADPTARFEDITFRDVKLPCGVEVYGTEGVRLEGGTLERLESSPERLKELREMTAKRRYPHT